MMKLTNIAIYIINSGQKLDPGEFVPAGCAVVPGNLYVKES